MDLVMSFHLSGRESEWLLLDAVSPLSDGALVTGKSSIWARDGRLLASPDATDAAASVTAR
jgi:acyl-CoA thioesterase